MTAVQHAEPIQCQVLTAVELAQLCGVSPRTVRDRVKRNGHFLGLEPVPDTGKLLFSAARARRTLGLEES